MHRFSNTVIGFLNLFTLLASIPIIGAGLWMARSSTTCENFLQTPLLVIGFVVLVVSLSGFIGACFHVACALWLYLVVMLFLIAALLGLTVFGFGVTSKGGGVEVPGRVYKEYRLQDYSPWLQKRVNDPRYWNTIRSCILGSKTCEKLASWTPLDYMQRDMSPIQVQLIICSLFLFVVCLDFQLWCVFEDSIFKFWLYVLLLCLLVVLNMWRGESFYHLCVVCHLQLNCKIKFLRTQSCELLKRLN